MLVRTKTMILAGLALCLVARAEQVRVAVLDFTLEKPTTEAVDWAVGLSDFVELALQRNDVPILERRQIRLILGERDLQAQGALAADTMRAAKIPAVEYFIGGSVSRGATNEFVLTFSIIRADTATVEAVLTRRGVYPEDWLPAIELLAKEAGTRLQVVKPEPAARSEFETLTWLPEAALPFFKGLEHYARGDVAGAVPWFRHAYERDQHFDMARRWEARAYAQLGLSGLADAVLPSGGKTNGLRAAAGVKRPVVAVVAAEMISAAGRATFMQTLTQSGQFDLFEPASIGATAREIDLQLTGQMAAPLNERSVWLVVDDLIYLDALDSETLAVRQQNLLSGEVRRQAKLSASNADEKSCAALAEAFLEGKSESSARNNVTDLTGQTDLPEPTRQDSGEIAMTKVLRLAAANPQSARLWIGLADFYSGETRKLLLERTVSAIETNRQTSDAAFWLASALWREREMTRRIFYVPTATRLAPNPLTNDFARLLQWYPNSYEAQNLVEITNHGEGSYVYTEIKDRRYLDSVFDYGSRLRPPPTPKPLTTEPVIQASQPVRVVTDEQKLARLNDYLKQNRTAPAWQLVNSLRTPDGSFLQPQVQKIYDALLQTVGKENQHFDEFIAAVSARQSQHTLELGRALLNCADRRHRAEVIRQCGELIRDEGSVSAKLKFVFAEAKQYRDDFLFDPVTGNPTDHVEYQLWPAGNTFLVGKVIYGPDSEYERLVGEVAEAAHDLASSDADLTARIFEEIRNDKILPLEKRLTAAYDLAMVEQTRGHNFEALDLIEDVLRQSEGTGLPLKRNNIWSGSIESAAFDALRKIRVYTGADVDVCDCCGKLPEAAPQKPANFDIVDRKLGQLWKQQVGEVVTNRPPVKEQLVADKENLFPVILYKLCAGQEVSHMLTFCANLGTNALPALPVIMKIIHRGEPFQDYNNALYAVGAFGPAAGCAKPILILAQENAENRNFNYALKRIGPAPRRVMPQLGALLHHKNLAICEQAARAMIETAGLGKDQITGESAEQLILSVRKWWEEKGVKQSWTQN
jgi:hypothetical protein